MSAKRIYSLLAFFIAFLIGMYVYNKYHVAPKIDISKLEIVNANNQKFDIKSLKGKKVIISFYASWCPNCIDELSDITVLAITDESIEKLVSFRDKKQYPFTFMKLTNPFSDIGIVSIPTVYLVNTNNEIVYDKVGYINWEDESTLSHLKKLME
jgi:thiol-disulfide isomerase/thioredoxin